MITKQIKTIEETKFNTLGGVREYLDRISEINLVHVEIDAPKVYEKKWVVKINWIEEGV